MWLEDVPLLLSARVLKDLGTVLNMADEFYSFEKLGASVKMVSTSTGHIGFNIFDKVPVADDLLRFDWEAFLETGEEVAVYDAGRQDWGHHSPLHPGSKDMYGGKCVRFNQSDEVYEYDDESVGDRDDVHVVQVCAQDTLVAAIPSTSQRSEDASSQEEGRICGGSPTGHESYQASVGRDDRGEVALDVQQCEAPQGSVALAGQLEEVQQARVAGALFGESGQQDDESEP